MSAAEPILVVDDVTKSFGALRASDHLSLEVRPGEIHALIGPNGAGKTTLISQIAGALDPDEGRILFAGRDLLKVPAARRPHLGLVRSYQITSIFPDFTALANVALAVQARAGHSFRFWKPAIADKAEREAAMGYLEAVGLGDVALRPAHALAHGQQRQLEIAMALALEPKLLLLDEPMAGMGPEESRFIVDLLAGLKGSVTMLLVEHDMDAVFALADRVSVLVYGRVIATDEPEAIRANVEVQQAYLGTHELHDAGGADAGS
ncbi:MAG: ABC transporter ATP-binding protein [Hyphomicrobiales bacterium]|nr:MAG: ABC transporter ATP-binding protein [Hyphomicrobiales bacterium]